jgi:hypothetical protein
MLKLAVSDKEKAYGNIYEVNVKRETIGSS